jgi:hypothetical protein
MVIAEKYRLKWFIDVTGLLVVAVEQAWYLHATCPRFPQKAFKTLIYARARYRIRANELMGKIMQLFSKTVLPMTLVVSMIVWAWVSFLSVAISSLF